MSYQQASLLDAAASRKERDAGLDLIERNRTDDVAAIKAVILAIGARQLSFTADEVRAAIDFEPSHANCVGAAFQSLARTKRIVKAGYTQSSAKARHAGMIARWRLA